MIARPPIAMLIPTLDQIGGAERQVILLARELATRGWRVTVVALSGNGGSVASDFASAGIDFVSLGMRRGWLDPLGWQNYLAWYRRNRPGIVHTHLPHATWFGRWVHPIAPVRVVVDTIHTSNTRSSSGGVGRSLGYRLSHWLTSQVTCVSQSVAQSVREAGMIPDRREAALVLPNGVPLPHLPADAKAKRGAAFQWIAVGRLAPVKDYPTMLRAFALLPGQPVLTIVGTGPGEAALRVLAAELGVASRVHFVGFQSNVMPLLFAADAFVQSSLWEGLPISVLEASAAGLPVVATDAAGTGEAMITQEMAEQTGILVPVGDIQALAGAMTRVMRMTRGERLEMGARGRKLIANNFALLQVVDIWEALYTQLLKSHAKPKRWG